MLVTARLLLLAPQVTPPLLLPWQVSGRELLRGCAKRVQLTITKPVHTFCWPGLLLLQQHRWSLADGLCICSQPPLSGPQYRIT